jgi:hypothetical protein
LCNEELHELHSSPNIIWVNKWRRMEWPGHVACGMCGDHWTVELSSTHFGGKFFFCWGGGGGRGGVNICRLRDRHMKLAQFLCLIHLAKTKSSFAELSSS